MKAPIFAYNKGDLLIFESIPFAESYLEPVDVRNSEYIIYDSEGRLVDAVIEKKKGFMGGERVKLENGESTPTHAPDLVSIIASFLSDVSGEPPSESDLEGLISASLKYATK